MGRLGIQELLILLVPFVLAIGIYRLGFNSGYRKALEKRLDAQREERH